MNPPPNPSQEGSSARRSVPLLEGVRGGFVADRFMKSLLSLLRMHWDHEPWKAPASWTHSKRFAKSQALGHCAAAFGVRGACSHFCTRFMESHTRWRIIPRPGSRRTAANRHGSRFELRVRVGV